MRNHRFSVIAIGVAASAVFVYLAVRRVDLDSVEDAFEQARLLPWVPLGIASYLLGHLVRGVRCRLLVRRESTIGLVTASNIVVVGYASNNVLPARLGEFVRAGMLAERTGMPIAQSLAVTFIERVLDGLSILVLLVIATLASDAPGWIHDLVRVALVVFGIATVMMVVAAQSPGLILAVSSRLGQRFGPRWHDRFVMLATSITNAGACLRDPVDAFLLVVYSLLVWSLEAGLFIAILPVFGIAPNLHDGVIAMSVTNLGLLLPSSPGFIGPFHYFCSRVLIAYGAAEPTALAYATLVHLAFYVPVTIWGAGAMLWYGVEAGSTAALAREAKRGKNPTVVHGVRVVQIAPVPVPAGPPKASAMTVGLVEAVVVGDGVALVPEAVAYAAEFVDGQLAALPPKLRIMFRFGMGFFRFATRVRFFRGYCDVPLPARRAWTRAWANGRIALVRQLFKPVRAIAVLAYYDHASVRQALLAPALISTANLVATPSAASRTRELV